MTGGIFPYLKLGRHFLPSRVPAGISCQEQSVIETGPQDGDEQIPIFNFVNTRTGECILYFQVDLRVAPRFRVFVISACADTVNGY